MDIKDVFPKQLVFMLGHFTDLRSIASLGQKSLKIMADLLTATAGPHAPAVGMLLQLHAMAPEWVPLLPCLRTNTYVRQHDSVRLCIPDRNGCLTPWLDGKVQSINHGLVTCATNESEHRVMVQSPYILSLPDCAAFRKYAQVSGVLQLWANGVDPNNRPADYNSRLFAQALTAV